MTDFISSTLAPVRTVQTPLANERAVQTVPSVVPQQQKTVSDPVSQSRADNQAQTGGADSASLLQGSNIVTFRDGDTGLLVVKLVGKNNNEVLAQFPSPTQLSNYPSAKPVSAGSGLDESV